jgi:sugar phosphate isomerase/epimerase
MAFPDMEKGDDEYLNAIKIIGEDPFFDGIEIPRPPDRIWDKIEDVLEDQDKVAILGAQTEVIRHGLNPSALEEEERKKAVEGLGNIIEDAGAHGVWLIALCSGPDPGANKRKEATGKLIESLNELCQKAEDCGANLLLETFDRTMDKKLLIGPMDEAIKVISEVRKEHDDLGLMWDLGHGPLLNEKPDVLRKTGELIEHIHIGCAKKADNGGLLDHHPGFYSKNSVNTEEDVADLLEELDEIDYFGFVGFEVKPQEFQTSKEVISTAKSVLVEAFERTVPRILAKK